MIILKISDGVEVDAALIKNYFSALVNCVFKILPMKENKEESLNAYMRSLQMEMVGCKELVDAINNDSMYLSLLSMLQYQIDNPNCPVNDTRREVFKAIAICNKLKARYTEEAN